MELKDIVCSLELSKRLKKAGWNSPTCFMWVKFELWKEPQVWNSDIGEDYEKSCLSGKREYAYPAPTVDESLEKLPKKIDYEDLGNYKENLLIYKDNKNYIVEYFGVLRFKNKSLANACAEMWLWLKDNGYIK